MQGYHLEEMKLSIDVTTSEMQICFEHRRYTKEWIASGVSWRKRYRSTTLVELIAAIKITESHDVARFMPSGCHITVYNLRFTPAEALEAGVRHALILPPCRCDRRSKSASPKGVA